MRATVRAHMRFFFPSQRCKITHGRMLPECCQFTATDPTIPISGRGNRHVDVRELVWAPFDEGAKLAELVDGARTALQQAIPGREPSSRDLNMLDHQLELAMQAASGDHRGVGKNETAYYDVESETDRFCMPHYALDEGGASPGLPNGAEADLLKHRYNIRNMGASTQTDSEKVRPPENMAVKIALARTMPFAAISKRDDELFASEGWRRHTSTDVITSETDAVPSFVPPVSTMSHHKLSSTVENARFEQVTDMPLFPDGHPAWFRGWDQFFDAGDPFPQEMA